MTTATTAPACAVPMPAPETDRAELRERAWAARRALGSRAVILGHHYQKDEVMEFADITGDSFLLARRGAAAVEAELVVFLGVYFMAEAADVLRAPHQTVVLPDLGAGCHLAECADIFTVRDAWDQMTAALPGRRVIPLTYMNSGADLKAFVGAHGGAVCTSGNAEKAFRWAMSEGDAVFFFPDEHLGRNTAVRLGMAPDEPVVWNPRFADLGGIRAEALADARVILWKGFCNVHTTFTVRQIEEARAADPDVRVIVHPECPHPVVEAADEDGSTEYIIRRCEELPAGASAVIGTDWNLVNRLRLRHPDKGISCLNEHICPCVTMNRIDLAKLTWCLESLVAGDVVNVVSVDPEMARQGRLALDRMLALA
ncbi:MAG: quinolinate synthase NadA [Thermoleophilia bacterium]